MRKLLILLLLTTPLWAQNVSLGHLRTDTAAFPSQVRTTVLALDKDAEPLTGLNAGSFEVTFSGTKVDSLAAAAPLGQSAQGMSYILCVDVSGSLKGDALAAVRNALSTFVESKKDNDEVALYAFAESPVLVTDFTHDTGKLRQSILNLKTLPGDTSLYYSIDEALGHTSTAKSEEVFLVLFSDGREDNPAQAYTIDGVIAKAREKQVPVFTVGYAPQSTQYLQYLERIAEETGGSHNSAVNATAIKDQFDKIRRQILGAYLLTYPVYGLAGDGGEHELSVVLNLEGARVQFPDAVKVRIPANRPALEKTAAESAGNKLPLWAVVAIIVGLLAIAAAVIVWLHRKRKQKLAEEAEELRRLQEQARLDAENQRRVESKPQPQVRREPVSPSRDHTVILPAGAQPGPAGGLRMEVMMGTEQGRTFNIGPEGATLGRAQGNSIVFNDPTVSSKHARIWFGESGFFIEDMSSLNGVYINGQKVARSRIGDGFTFKLGSNEGTFHLH
jgi:VWFA-related protein